MKFVFIHGYMSNPEADWYPAVRSELEKLGHKVSIPAMPGHKHPPAEEWLEIIKNEVEPADQPVFLVGHSLGTRAIVLYLNQASAKNLEQILLIAPPDIKDHPKSDNAWHAKVAIDRVKGHKITILASKDDQIVPFEGAKGLAEKLDAKLIEVDGHGHFTKPADAELILKTLRG